MAAQRRFAVHLHARGTLINGLRILWVVIILWYEFGVFIWSLLVCRWPDHALTSRHTTHILLVADPQMLDNHSYPGRPNWLMTLTRYIVNFNLRKNWDAVITKFAPHMVIFLGDMMDNGRENMDDDRYLSYHRGFRSIFRLRTSVPVYYLPGNHDVGLGSFTHHSSPNRARERYQQNFGTVNQRLEVSNHTFALLDAPGLVDEVYQRQSGDLQHGKAISGGAVEFLQGLTTKRPDGPLILLSHIPLFRPDRSPSPCGPLREKGTIRPGVGLGYQNLIFQETSSFILENIRPSVVFSGDDHDFCEYVHTLTDGSRVREVTVKSFSMAMGIQRPGFQLLSLSPISANTASFPHSPTTFADTACFLPNQMNLYTHGYAPLAMITVVFLFFFNYRHRHHRHSTKASPSLDMRLLRDALSFRTPSSAESSLPTRIGRLYISRSDEESDESYGMSSFKTSDLDEAEKAGAHDLSAPSDYREASSENGRPSRCRRRVLGRASFASSFWLCGGSQRSWYRKAINDICQLAWPPVCAYCIISLWTFWR